MKTITLLILITCVLACRTPERAHTPARLNIPVWINDDMLEITLASNADTVEKTKAIRRIKTRHDAEKKARCLIYDATLGTSSGNFKKHLEITYNNPMAVVSERTPEFPNGIIMEMKYDEDDRCTIRYRIHAIKLRETIKRIEEKYR